MASGATPKCSNNIMRGRFKNMGFSREEVDWMSRVKLSRPSNFVCDGGLVDSEGSEAVGLVCCLHCLHFDIRLRHEGLRTNCLVLFVHSSFGFLVIDQHIPHPCLLLCRIPGP